MQTLLNATKTSPIGKTDYCMDQSISQRTGDEMTGLNERPDLLEDIDGFYICPALNTAKNHNYESWTSSKTQKRNF